MSHLGVEKSRPEYMHQPSVYHSIRNLYSSHSQGATSH